MELESSQTGKSSRSCRGRGALQARGCRLSGQALEGESAEGLEGELGQVRLPGDSGSSYL